jgi:hypothetical protein
MKYKSFEIMINFFSIFVFNHLKEEECRDFIDVLQPCPHPPDVFRDFSICLCEDMRVWVGVALGCGCEGGCGCGCVGVSEGEGMGVSVGLSEGDGFCVVGLWV